jgi:ADP-ribose pyrophosphatase
MTVTKSRRGRPRLIGRTIPFRGRVFRIEQDRVRLPNGRPAVLEIVRHGGSVVLIVQPSPQSVVLIRQFRYAINRWIWELPAGSIEPGEAPRRAARRECEEEIGLTPRHITRAGALYPTPGFCDEIMLFYHCTRLVKPTRRVDIDPDEQIEPRVYSLQAAGRLVKRGAIVDMKTILGLGLIRP